MKRQIDKQITSRVYSYGAVAARVAPVLGEEQALEQMRLGNRLWNVLVAIERARKARYLRIMHDTVAERIEALKIQRRAWRDEMKSRRKEARKRQGVDVADLQAALDQSRGEMALLIAEHRSTREARHLAAQAELTANAERYKQRIVRARQAVAAGCDVDSARARNRRARASGGKMEIRPVKLYWGTYNEIIQRADAGRKHGGELHFRGFRGAGTLTAQVMNGAAVDRCVEGTHTVFQVGPVERILRSAGRRPGRHRQELRRARMRTGSLPDRSPVWLDVPIVYHRAIPADANIRSVSLTRRNERGKESHQLNVTVNLPRPAQKQGPAVAIDIGWRLLPEGVRVAYWVDEAGRQGQVLVEPYTIRPAQKVPELRSLCDDLRNRFILPLAAWLDGQELSEEWKAKSSHLIQCQSGDRLARLIRWWADHRLPGDHEAYEEAVWWRKRHLHLANWWRNLQDQIGLRLREQYRVFAAGVARDYATLVLEDFDLREVAKLPEPEAEPGATTSSSTYRHIVAPSVLRAALRNACQREGTRIVEMPAPLTTRRCHACGYEGAWDQIADIVHRCQRCGELWDQDLNGATNLLALWRESREREAVPA